MKYTIFSQYNQQDAAFFQFIYFCKTMYMFQPVFPPIIRSSKLHIQRQVFFRPILLPGDRVKHVERRTEINKLRNVAPCWLYSANILAMRGRRNVKKKVYQSALYSAAENVSFFAVN